MNKKTLTPSERVMKRVQEIGLNNAEFCRQIMESTQNLNNWIKRGSIPADKLHKVSLVIDRSVDWILTGDDYLYAEGQAIASSANASGFGVVSPSNFGLKRIEKLLKDAEYTLNNEEVNEILGYIQIKINLNSRTNVMDKELATLIIDTVKYTISKKPKEERETYSAIDVYNIAKRVYENQEQRELTRDEEMQVMHLVSGLKLT